MPGFDTLPACVCGMSECLLTQAKRTQIGRVEMSVVSRGKIRLGLVCEERPVTKKL
jgi:hypothetical protein